MVLSGALNYGSVSILLFCEHSRMVWVAVSGSAFRACGFRPP